jgi:hypothetical protein
MKKIITTVVILSYVSLVLIAQKFGAPMKGPKDHDPPPEDFGTIPDEEVPELTAEKVISESKDYNSLIISTGEADKSVLLVCDGAEASMADSSFNKRGGDTSNDGQSNFYGLNAALLVKEGKLNLSNAVVSSSADGSNAVFATGEKSFIEIDGIKIRTTKDSSRGLDATYGGTINARRVEISTLGAHSAAFATDRGEGNINVKGGTAYTAGEGSPVIYSTGNISVTNLEGKASGSEIAVIEGKNSIKLNNVKLTGGIKNCAIMLYQSMSGDANRGTASFSAKDSTLTSTSEGSFFYITNTSAKISLANNTLDNPTEKLIQVSQNNSERGWGRRGANGGTLEFTSEDQELEGDITVDEISSASLHFKQGTKFTGAINSQNQGKVDLYLDKDASLTLTEDSYVNILSLDNKKAGNIVSNGYTLYYNKDAKENKWLRGKTVSLKDGGQLVGIEMEFKEPAAFDDDFDSRPKPPAPPKGNPPKGNPPQM